ncbi:MAG: hypothetical protein ACUVRH_02535 [Candidatus Bipolaricaulia bacterium]
MEEKGPAPTPMKPLTRGLLGGYCLLLIILLLYLIIAIFPAADEVLSFSLGPETRLILLIALVGALGACIHMATSFAFFAGKSELSGSWLWWYLLRPFIGAALATILYLVLRGLFFSTAAEAKTVNLFGVLAFAGLAGMFSKQAIEWLRQIFDQVFRRLSDVEKG